MHERETAMSTATFPRIADPDTREQPTETRLSDRGTQSPRDHRPHGGRLRRLFAASYRDSLFERPDLVEDDYYRLINQPRGW